MKRFVAVAIVCGSIFVLTVFVLLVPARADGRVVLASPDSGAVPVVHAVDAPQSVVEAAHDLAAYIGRISGMQPEIIAGAPGELPPSAIWVGLQPGLPAGLAKAGAAIAKPEEIFYYSDGDHVLVAGRDRFSALNGEQIEFGTANAVYTFIERELGVRWLWPGELGEVVPRSPTIAVGPLDFRFSPPIRERFFHYPRGMVQPENNRWFEVLQRGRGSLSVSTNHYFNQWWARYSEDYPEIFSMQLDGTRGYIRAPHGAKLCVSNPRVAELWLAEAEAALRQDPDLLMVSAVPTDGGGWCLCPECLSWDVDGAPPSTYSSAGQRLEHVMLTDRYVRFWNILARGLRERFPDREVYVGAAAYARYKTLPVEQVLDDNVVIAYVGHFPITTEEVAAWEKADMLEWGKMAAMLSYRPNLFWYSGGTWGLPNIALERTIEDMEFIAKNNVVSLRIDSFFMNWANLGPQLYLFTQLAYDPLQDGHALLRDYYEKGFGPAADHVAAYFDVLGEGHQRFLEWEEFRNSGGLRYQATDVYPDAYSQELLQRAQEHLERARESVAGGDPEYAERVAFIQSGLDFTRLQLDVMQAMAAVRASRGADVAAVERAAASIAARDAFYDSASPLAIDRRRIEYQTDRRGMTDYLGPIKEEFLKAAAEAAKAAGEKPRPAKPVKGEPGWDPDLDA